jgi:hypothetical protein
MQTNACVQQLLVETASLQVGKKSDGEIDRACFEPFVDFSERATRPGALPAAPARTPSG